jgi:hypothetical protein
LIYRNPIFSASAFATSDYPTKPDLAKYDTGARLRWPNDSGEVRLALRAGNCRHNSFSGMILRWIQFFMSIWLEKFIGAQALDAIKPSWQRRES